MESVPSLAPARLSRRQRQIIALLSWGRSVRDIAEMIRISPKTVENVRCVAYAKLGTHSRVIVTRWAMRYGVDLMTPAALTSPGPARATGRPTTPTNAPTSPIPIKPTVLPTASAAPLMAKQRVADAPCGPRRLRTIPVELSAKTIAPVDAKSSTLNATISARAADERFRSSQT